MHPEDAVKTSLHWVLWGCPEGFITHMTISGRAAEVAVGTRYCGNCRSLDRWYATHTAGMLLTRSKVARAKVESAFVARLRELLPGERVAAQQAIVVPRAFAARVGKSVTPDVILFRRRIAIELDGGDGQSDRYSRHDTLAGAEGDTARDQALASIGWTTIRVRHPDALALPGSPAVIVSTRAATGGSGLKIAQVVAEQVKALLVLR